MDPTTQATARYLVINEDGNCDTTVPMTMEQAEKRAAFYKRRAHDFTPYGVSKREAMAKVRIEQVTA